MASKDFGDWAGCLERMAPHSSEARRPCRDIIIGAGCEPRGDIKQRVTLPIVLILRWLYLWLFHLQQPRDSLVIELEKTACPWGRGAATGIGR